MKTLKDVIKEIEGNVTTTANGKPKRTFSRSDFDKLSTALVNDVDYTITTVSTKGGDIVENVTTPVKEFRSDIKKVLSDFGVDKQEAERVMTADYQFPTMKGLYGVVSACITEYCGAGKKFDFPTQRDLKASITMENVPKTKKEYKSIQTLSGNGPQETFEVETEAHRVLKSSSKAPKWLKKKCK